MNMTPSNVGHHRFHSHDRDYANRNNSAAAATTNVAVTTNGAPTTIAPVEAAATVDKPAFDAEALAKSILSFVQNRLAKEVDAGASKDALTALLKQARDGVAAGFDQAVKELKDSGSLTDELSSGISSALQKVDSGLDDLAKQFGLTDAAPTGDNTSPTTAKTPSVVDAQTNTTAVPQTGSLSQLAAAYKSSFSSKQSAELLVKTADGDTVRLQLGVKQKQSISASYLSDSNGQQLSLSSREKSSGSLSISVDGNLDAGELQALGDLLNQIGDLADSFFNGDMSAALEKAGALDFSNPELSAMSLDLRSEITTRSAIAAYSAVQSLTDTPSSAPAVTLPDLADALTSLLPKASVADNPASLLKQLLAAQLGANDQQNNPLVDFANRLLDALGASKTAEASVADVDSAAITDTATTPAADETQTDTASV
ncbi:MAG: DUF5610 domain-containing protein [Spongiibacteraceae bacterium]